MSITVEKPQDAEAKSTVQASLRILATSDLHANLAPYDYATDCASAHIGLVRTATLIEQARAEADVSILVDNGDFLQGSPLGDHAALTAKVPHPVIAAMNHLQYDAVNLGNHEFSHGIAVLEQAIAQANFPVLSANTLAGPGPHHPHRPATTGLSRLKPWTIVKRELRGADGHFETCQIGIIGVLPPETQIWDREAIGGRVHMAGMTEMVRHYLPEIKAAGADVVVLLAHCGLGNVCATLPDEDGAFAMAQLPGVDAVVMGHIHMAFPSPDAPRIAGVDPIRGMIAEKPAVMPGFYGSHVGQIDFKLHYEDGKWHITQSSACLLPIAARRPDGVMRPLARPAAELARLIAPAHRAARAWARLPIGTTASPIHSYFSLITDTPVLQLINLAQTEYVRERLKGGQLAHIPVLSAASPFRAGGRGGPENFTAIPSGNLLLRHAADIYGHPNTIMALRVTGQELREWLSRAAQGYCHIQPGLQDQPLLEPAAPPFLFDTISGVEYEIDVCAAPGTQRISKLHWQGRPVRDDDSFILATNSYRGAGSGGIVPVGLDRVVLTEPVQNRDILVSYLGRSAPFECGPAAWRFRSVPDTSVIFDTAITAEAHLPQHPELALTPLARTPDGFQTFRLAL